MAELRVDIEDGVALVTMDNPPVNAASQDCDFQGARPPIPATRVERRAPPGRVTAALRAKGRGRRSGRGRHAGRSLAERLRDLDRHGRPLPLDADPGQRTLEPAGQPQLPSPNSAIVAGTSSMRTMVASSRMATARPKPNILAMRSSSKTKLPKITTMIAAAPVITRAVEARPSATEPTASPARSNSSLTRESRKIL